MDRAQKAELVSSLHDVFSGAGVVVVAHYSGMTVSQMSDLRGRMREAGAKFKVSKNRLARRALEDTSYTGVGALLKGPTGVGYSEDPIAAARVLVKYAKENEKLIILGGAMGGTALDVNGVKALAELPSLDELRGKLAGLLQAPAQKLAAVAQAPAGQLARVFQAYADKNAA